MSRTICYLITITLSLTVVSLDTSQGQPYTDLVETDLNDPNWVLVTSEVILREDLCGTGSGSRFWYEKVFNPCYSYNNYWKLAPYAETGRAFPMSELAIGINTLDSLYAREGIGFQIYYDIEEPSDPNLLLPITPCMNGPQYVSLDYYRDFDPPPDGFEPGTFFVSGGAGGLEDYSIIIYDTTLPPCRCFIVNGSFEDDAFIGDITINAPNGWDVNVPAGKFGGSVDTKFATHGNYNLTLYSEWYTTFSAGDIATVSQQVDLKDADIIYFDLKLDTYGSTPWDPDVCTAVLLIDGEVVWESNSVGSDVRGEYFGQRYTVEDEYRVGGPYKLSLGIRVNMAEYLEDFYMTEWDLLKCNLLCEGFGFLPSDFSFDCCVNFFDFAMLANQWLEENPPFEYDLVEDGKVDTNDLRVFVDSWLECSNPQTNNYGAMMMDQECLAQSRIQLNDLTERSFQDLYTEQGETKVVQINIEEIQKWLDEIWLLEEVRKLITEDEWQQFVESVRNTENITN